MKLKAFVLLSMLGLSASSFADEPKADEQPKPLAPAPEATPPAAPAGMPGMPGMGGAAPVMFRAGGIGTIGFIAYDLFSLGVAYLPIEHMMVAASVTLQWNGNTTGPMAGVFIGAPGLRQFDPVDNLESGLLVACEYMIKDAMPFAMGPALAIRTNIAPINALGVGAFGQWVIMPAWDLWYTPFNAPMAIGAALGINITLTSGFNPVVTFATPAMRLAYTF